MTGNLVLIRHGEIVRPAYTSNFDRAPLSTWGEAQIRALSQAWPVERPTAIFASPLRRSIESALLVAEAFGLSIMKRPRLKEWSADDAGIPQPEYKALERRSWADFDFVPPSKESLAQAAIRGVQCIEGIAEEVDGSTAAVVAHGTLLSLVTATLKGERPKEAYKDSIQFASAAIVEIGSDLPRRRLVRPFCPGERAGDHIALGVLYLVYSVPTGTEPGTPPGPVGIPEPDLRTHGDGRSEHLDVRCLDGPRRGGADGPPPPWRQDVPHSKGVAAQPPCGPGQLPSRNGHRGSRGGVRPRDGDARSDEVARSRLL